MRKDLDTVMKQSCIPPTLTYNHFSPNNSKVI